MVRLGPRNEEVAERILRDRRDELSEEERAYLRHVIEESARYKE